MNKNTNTIRIDDLDTMIDKCAKRRDIELDVIKAKEDKFNYMMDCLIEDVEQEIAEISDLCNQYLKLTSCYIDYEYVEVETDADGLPFDGDFFRLVKINPAGQCEVFKYRETSELKHDLMMMVTGAADGRLAKTEVD